MLENSKWIWLDKPEAKDEFAVFTKDFVCGGGKTRINICAETNYLLKVNGKVISYGQYAGYKTVKYYDTLDITDACKKGDNHLQITVWYEGYNSFTHIDDGAGLIFSIVEDGKEIAVSDKTVNGGIDKSYAQGEKKLLTVQIGYAVKMINTNEVEVYSVKEIEKTNDLLPRPVKKLTEEAPIEAKLIDAEKRVYDLGAEDAGYLYVKMLANSDTVVNIAYGEYLENGNVNRILPGGYKALGRDFSLDFVCKRGENIFTNYFIRIAGRYLQVDGDAEILSLGILPAYYPLTEKKIELDGIDKKIYDTCIRTLKLCMHEHYEDCPWREQALYSMDSRNQMLCGYYAFEETEFQRASLELIAKGVRPDGLLELTYPAVDTPAIPFFSLIYPIAVNEYIEHTGDLEIIPNVYPTLEKLMQVFKDRVQENGLIKNFEAPYWNFYEWSKGSDNEEELLDGYVREEKTELILNCAFVLASKSYIKIAKAVGKSVNIDVEKTQKAIKEFFYNKEKGLFKLSTAHETYSQLGNAMAILAGVGNKMVANALIEDQTLVSATLSMLGFVYDALLETDKNNAKWIMSDIRKNYTYMLEKGATTFWETIEGVEESRSQSLCHGWSAMPVYYYNKIK